MACGKSINASKLVTLLEGRIEKENGLTNYCPRNEIKKLEAELWNLKVKGTDVTGYNQRFQELALLCVRMFPEESDKVERYVGGLPNMIHGSVVASKNTKNMQAATDRQTELMDKKISILLNVKVRTRGNLQHPPSFNINFQEAECGPSYGVD
ncbi:reverse transcriptase domain-containing protein [Tanacetum coccineum]